MTRLAIEVCSVFGMPPVEYVNLTSDLECQHITTPLTPFAHENPYGYPTYSLRDDPALRRELIAALRDRGVSISVGEGVVVHVGVEIESYAADLDIMTELGVERINTVTTDPDLHRSFDQFGRLVEMVAERGMETTLELAPYLPIGDLPTALAAVRHVARPDFRLLIDVMHLVRSGSGAADIAALDPALIAYVQLSDVPAPTGTGSYYDEAIYERLVPGTGSIGVPDLLKVLPRDRVFGIELPQLRLAEAGVPSIERLRPCVAAVRELLAQADA